MCQRDHVQSSRGNDVFMKGHWIQWTFLSTTTVSKAMSIFGSHVRVDLYPCKVHKSTKLAYPNAHDIHIRNFKLVHNLPHTNLTISSPTMPGHHSPESSETPKLMTPIYLPTPQPCINIIEFVYCHAKHCKLPWRSSLPQFYYVIQLYKHPRSTSTNS